MAEKSSQMNNKLCIQCGAQNTYELKNVVRRYEGDGYHFEMSVKIPFCTVCGAPLYDEEIEKDIAERANQKIREQRNIISREEILKILETYNVSQKFLSRLLGWGEITLTRYIGGNYTPNISNSNKLKELKNPYIFQMLMQNFYENGKYEEKEKKALKKAENGVVRQLNELKKIQGKIIDVVNWFLAQSSDEEPVTHLALQKLLYFTQSWSLVLLNTEIFSDDCQAWVHGAVYPEIYKLFKTFKYMPLPKVKIITEFNENELKILEAVKSYYFDVYTAKTLETICHREEPYIRARDGYIEIEPCRTTIDKNSIALYYKYISKEYNINLSHLSNIKRYLNAVLNPQNLCVDV